MIKRSFLGAVLLAAAFSAQADSFNVNELTCGELLSLSDEEMGLIIFWIDGYLSGVTGDTQFNDEMLSSFAERMGAACAKSPDSRVLDTARIVGIQ
jgi:acid stress chaperone HdeB